MGHVGIVGKGFAVAGFACMVWAMWAIGLKPVGVRADVAARAWVVGHMGNVDHAV